MQKYEHKCSNCGKYKKDCFYFNIQRLEMDKGRACPMWCPLPIEKTNLISDVIKKLMKHG